MKKIIFTTLLALTVTGCNRPSDPTSESSVDSKITAQFEKSDNRISKFLDRLDDPNTPQDARIQILCKDYPAEYKINYMPALMELSPGEYTKGKLIKDLDTALDYYKKKDNIQC